MLSDHPQHVHGAPMKGFQGLVDRTLTALEHFVAGWQRVLLRWKILPILGLVGALAVGGAAALNIGRDFFPETDAGMIRTLHARHARVRASKETARQFSDVQLAIRNIVPPGGDRVHRREHRRAGADQPRLGR